MFYQPGFVSIPAAATIYVQVIGSEALWNMHQFDSKQVKSSQIIFIYMLS